MKKQLITSTLSLILSAAFSACGNDAGNDRERDQETFIRIFNGVTDAPGVDVAVDDELYFSDVGYLESSGYFKIDTIGRRLQISVTDSFTPIYQRDGGFDDESDNSLFIYGNTDEERSLIVKDENQSPGEDFSKVRVVNLSRANRRSLDVYIATSDSTSLPSAPTAEGIGTGAISRYVTSTNGQYDIVVTSSNSTERLASLTRQTFDSKGVYTVVIADSVGGELPLKVVLLKDSK